MMSHRDVEAPPHQPRTDVRRAPRRAGAAARPARPTGGPRAGRQGHGARAVRHRWRPGRRPGAGLPARAVRRACPWRGFGLRRGAARPADGGWRPRGLDRAERRAVRTGPGRAGTGAGAPGRGPHAVARGAALGARGSLAQPGTGRRARRGRSAEPHPEQAAAARRRSEGGDRLAAAAAAGRCPAERRRDALADHGGPEREGGAAGLRSARVADQPGPLPRRPHRQLADRLAPGWWAWGW
jgi:hypothetical protein